MSNKIIAIGGTGIKCLESFIHYCAVNNKKTEYDVLIVEADNENGNLLRLQETIESYIKVQDILYHGNIFAEDPIYGFGGIFVTNQFNRFKVWNPTNRTEHSNTLSGLDDFMKSDIAKALYTSDEINVDLDQGFRGHPSIGALMNGIAMDIKNDTTWNHFIGKESNVHGQNSKILIFGSLFGGTGAAGIYSILDQIIKFEIKEDNINIKYIDKIKTGAIKICAGMMTPYYELPPKTNGVDAGIVASHITDYTKYALRFYSDYNEIIDNISIILVGKNDTDIMRERVLTNNNWVTQKTSYSPGGMDQKNPSSIVELVMASASSRFFSNNDESLFNNGNTYIPARNKSIDADIKSNAQNILWSAMRSCDENFAIRLRTMLFVALCYTKKLHPILKSNIGSIIKTSKYADYGWLKYFEFDFKEMQQDTEDKASYVSAYYKGFIQWLHCVCNITVPNEDEDSYESLNQLVNVEAMESILVNSKYNSNIDYRYLILGNEKKHMQWNKKRHKVEARLNDGANADTNNPGYSMYRLLDKLYKIGGIKK